ncbi:MAG: hypothetical protein FWG39_00205 [Alphaproteobacteria bacterium]|nr:hypothetical protein [Alphaproteobacteria bacterium]
MNTPPFLRGYRVLRMPIMDAGGAPAWPAVFPPEKIDQIRQTVGPRHFSAQMMLEYISEEKSRLDPDAIKFYNGDLDLRAAKLNYSPLGGSRRASAGGGISEEFFCPPPKDTLCLSAPPDGGSNLSITGYAVYWDPSSARRGADGSVIALVLRDDKTRAAFIHDIKYLAAAPDDPHPFATQCDQVLDFMAAFGLRHIAIEVNGIGNALPEILRGASIARGQPLVIRKIINSAKKETRILDAIEPLLGTGRLYAHERVCETGLFDEMADWSPAATVNRDDGLDAVAGALRMTPIALRPRGAARMINAKTEFKI